MNFRGKIHFKGPKTRQFRTKKKIFLPQNFEKIAFLSMTRGKTDSNSVHTNPAPSHHKYLLKSKLYISKSKT